MKLHPILTALALSTLWLARPAPAHAASCGTDNLLAGKKASQLQDIKGDVGQVTDGTVGAEGTVWDAPVVVTMETPAAQLTYDLGEAREVSAIVAQADANDTYRVSGSLDGSPGSYKVLTELPNAIDRGHGLRTRAVEVPPTTLRYLRFSDPRGDNYYSLSELAAYCKKPSPFPPKMKVVENPAQSAEPAVAPAKDGGRSVLLLAAVALGLAWLAYRTLSRGGSSKGSEGGGNAPGSEPAAGPGGPGGPPSDTGGGTPAG